MKLVRSTSNAIIYAVILFLITIVAILSCGEQKSVIRIGAVLPLTGNSAVWGVPTKEGIELAADLINQSGGIGGKIIEVIFEDSQGSPAAGVSALKKLIEFGDVFAVIDNSNSSVTLAMAPIANKNKVVLLVTGASSPDIAEAGDFIFRIWNSDALEGSLMANFAKDTLKATTSAVIFANNAYGQGLNKVFGEVFRSRGGRIVAAEGIEETSTDFRSIISKVVAARPDVIYIVLYPNQGAPLIVQLREMGITIPLLGAVAFEDQNFYSQVGSSGDGLIYPLPAETDTLNETYKSFKAAFVNKYKKRVPFLAAEGYDALNLLADIYKEGKVSSGESIRDALYEIKAYNGVSGLISFDEKGEVNKPFGIREVRNGQPVWRVKSIMAN